MMLMSSVQAHNKPLRWIADSGPWISSTPAACAVVAVAGMK